MNTSMEKIRDLVDVNTIIGEPISSPDGTTIIPISKVSFGFVSGGSDLPTSVPKDVFAGGAGAGISIKPQAFIVISKDGDAKILELGGISVLVGKLYEYSFFLVEFFVVKYVCHGFSSFAEIVIIQFTIKPRILQQFFAVMS